MTLERHRRQMSPATGVRPTLVGGGEPRSARPDFRAGAHSDTDSAAGAARPGRPRRPADILRLGAHAWSEYGPDGALEWMHEHIEYRDPPSWFDGDVHRGRSAVLEAQREQVAVMGLPWIRVEVVAETGDAAVAALELSGATGARSGLAWEGKLYVAVQVEDGLVRRWSLFDEREDALAELGARPLAA